jgi:Ca2+-binding EF-hand superfamily protein
VFQEEEEEEEEEEVVNEKAVKKKYSRDGENPEPWLVASLSTLRKGSQVQYAAKGADGKNADEEKIESWERYFYPATQFSVKNYTFSKGVSLEFPDYLYMSNNYYDKSWSFKTHRRLKNVIVTMDFVPTNAGLKEVAAVSKPFTPQQEKNLKRAFEHGKDGGISIHEIREVLRAVDVDVDGEEGDKFFEKLNLAPTENRVVTFDELKNMLIQRMYYRVQAGRYYVALSLFEAECMRAALHQNSGLPLVPGKDMAVALRTDRTMLDASVGYSPAQSFQDSTAQACYRFIDSNVNYQPRELNLLLRALQNNTCEQRYNYFVEVRSNRRRKQKDPATTSLSKVFITADEHHLLSYRIASGRITALLKSRGMYPRDAFAAFDRDRDGLLNYEDLKRGLEWLGLKLDQALMLGFMKEVDKDKDGYINLDEFKKAVGWEGSDGAAAAAADELPAFGGAMMPLPPMPPTDEEAKKHVKIPEAVLAGIKLKAKKITKFIPIWDSKGTMSRYKASIWAPVVQSSSFRANKANVTLGHFGGHDFDNPNKDGKDRWSLEVTDTTGSFIGGSSWLPIVLERYLPNPARFRLAWSLTHGNKHFYAWEPVPPGDEYVALGFIGSTTDKPPDVRCMRCVARAWCTESTFVHKLWDDSGSGGRQGSIWLFNTLNYIGFVSGSDPPARRPFDLRSRRFFLREYSDTSSTNVVPVAIGGYQNPKG